MRFPGSTEPGNLYQIRIWNFAISEHFNIETFCHMEILFFMLFRIFLAASAASLL